MPTSPSRLFAWCSHTITFQLFSRTALLTFLTFLLCGQLTTVHGLPSRGLQQDPSSSSSPPPTSPSSFESIDNEQSTLNVLSSNQPTNKDESVYEYEVKDTTKHLSKREVTDSDRTFTPAGTGTTTTTVDPTYGMWSTENGTNHTDHKKHKGHGVHVAEWRWEHVKTPFIYTAFVITAGLCKIGYHHADFLSSIVPESCLLIILGTAVGSILYVTGSEDILPQFDSRTFFLFLLPPIVLESAYSLHDRAFFGNLGTILLYAVVGTLLNCFTIGPSLYGLSELGALGPLTLGALECLIFSALISAVDPVAVLAIFQEVGVHKALYFLVFGESLLNDAVTVVLYTMMVALAAENTITAGQLGLGVVSFFCVSLGGLAIGVFLGALTALVTKNTHSVRVVEPLAMLGVAYLAYLLAEMVHFSGIISIIGCGLVQAQYAWGNISQKSYTTVKYFSKMLSAVCDTVIFLFLGMVLVNDQHVWNTAFVLWSTLLCLIFRFVGVLLLTYLANSFDRIRRINLEEQFIMGYGGLRGAVAFSLVIMLDKDTVPHKDMFVTTTLFVVLFTVFIQGGTIKPLVNLLKIRLQTGEKHCLFVEINTKVVDSVMAGIEEITGSHGGNYWTHVLYHYDEKYLKKWLQRGVQENNLTRVYTKLVLADHFAHLYGPATVIEENQPLKLIDGSEELNEEDVLSITCPPKNDAKMSVDKTENRKNSVQESPPPVSRRRNTIVSPIASFRRRTTNSAPQEEDPSKLLHKALQENPYNKLHFKYNPNLVEDDHQELLTHLRARRLRARRLTLAAMSSLGSSNSSSIEDLRMNTGSQSLNLPGDGKASAQPMSPIMSAASPINDQTINYLLERANRRRSIMSGKSMGSKMERANTIASGGSLMSSLRSKRGEESRLKLNDNRVNSSDSKVTFGSIESVESENEEKLTSPIKRQATKRPVKDPRMKKSLTFDVSSMDNDDISDIEETGESKF